MHVLDSLCGVGLAREDRLFHGPQEIGTVQHRDSIYMFSQGNPRSVAFEVSILFWTKLNNVYTLYLAETLPGNIKV